MAVKKLLTQKEINIIRGKVEVGKAKPKDILRVFDHWDLMEDTMNGMERDDFFGTEGWRHFFGLPDAD